MHVARAGLRSVGRLPERAVSEHLILSSVVILLVLVALRFFPPKDAP